ncbi:integral membrane protein [Colletotrichum tabaci]|uniref:Integral membrane protein n=1 Tax=Colletotrichum tabaci TaxID=1209068 RepID=A0AAV9TH80_9PEZI
MSNVEGPAAPPPEGVVPDFQNPKDVLHTINLVSQILSIVMVSLFMMLRLYAKMFIAPPFHTEDWVAVVAWILSLGYSATALVMYRYGGGFHVYELSKADFMGFNKLALLLVVLRVFRFHNKTRIGIYALSVFMTGYYLPVFVLKALICRPVAGFWDSSVEAVCFDQRAIFVADTVISAITDLAVLCLPIPVAVTLRMPWTRRLKVIAMLSAGGVATAASVVRMVIVIQLQKSNDQSVDFIRFNLLGTAEVSIGMICACFPAVNILFTHGFDCSQESSRNTGGSSTKRIIELKFLKGSRLRTQQMTEAQVEPQPETQQPPIPERVGVGYIFPIERLSRLQSSSQPGVRAATPPDEWCSQVVSSPFSEPDSPDWARKGSVC